MSPGSIERPKAKKNSAANASRRGSTSRWMRRAAAVPASTRPAMNAPIASDTPSSSRDPGHQQREADEQDDEELVVLRGDDGAHHPGAVPGDQPEHDQEGERPDEEHDALADAVGLPEDGRQAARYSARNRSSSTMIPRISRVSGLPRRRSSTRSFVTMALDEMPVAPAMTSASLLPTPTRSRRPARRPG